MSRGKVVDPFAAAFDGDSAALERWLDTNKTAANTTLHPERSSTLLYTAARFGKADCVAALLAAGADANVANGGEDKSRPIHGACFGGHAAIVTMLRAAGAETDVKNSFGETPAANAKAPAKGTATVAKTATQKALTEPLKATEPPARKKSRAEPAPEPATAAEETAAPPKKAPTKAKAGASAAVPLPDLFPAVTTKPLLAGQTVVFTGKFSAKKAVLENLVMTNGGKTAGSVSGKTTIVVVGKDSGDKAGHGYSMGLRMWSEKQLSEVVAGGAIPAEPTPAWAMGVYNCDRLSDAQKRQFVISWRQQFHHASMYPTGAGLGAWSKYHSTVPIPKWADYGVAALLPAVAVFPGTSFSFSYNHDDEAWTAADVQAICGCLAERQAPRDAPGPDGTTVTLQPVSQIIFSGDDVTDTTFEAFAAAVPRLTGLCGLQMTSMPNVSAAGLKAVLKGLEAVPALKNLAVVKVGKGCKAIVDAWAAGRGLNVTAADKFAYE